MSLRVHQVFQAIEFLFFLVLVLCLQRMLSSLIGASTLMTPPPSHLLTIVHSFLLPQNGIQGPAGGT